MNDVLDRLDFKKQIVKMIPKAEHIYKHKYDQAKCLSITIRDYIANNTNTEIRHWSSNIRSLK